MQFGSTTQSSATGDRVGIDDANAVSFNSGQILFTIKNSSATRDEISTDDIVRRYRKNADMSFAQLEKAIFGGGTLYLDDFTDIERLITRNIATGGAPILVRSKNTNYLISLSG